MRVAAAVLLLAIFGAGELAPLGGRAAVAWWADAGWTCCAILAVGGCAAAARRTRSDRRAWLLFTAGCVTWLLGQCVWDYYEQVARTAPPFPSWGDAGWLGFVPWFAAGIVSLAHFDRSRSGRAVFGLDLAIVVLALGLVGAVATQDLLYASLRVTDAGKAVAMAYPSAYLTLGFGAFLLLLRVPRLAASPAMWLLLLGLFCEGAGFVAWVPLLLNGSYHDGTALDVVWMAGLLAIGLAGLEWDDRQERPFDDTEGAPDRPLPALYMIPTILGTSVALAVPALAIAPARALLEACARVLIGLIALRQLSAVIQNVRLYQAQAQQRALAERRAARLRHLQESGQKLGLDLDPEGIAQVIVDTVCATLGYRLAVLNLVLNPDAPDADRRIRPAATAGLEPTIAARFLAQEAPASDAFAFLDERFRISRSYFVPASEAGALFVSSDLPRWTPTLQPSLQDGWRPGDEFFISLIERRTGRFHGFISVDDPVDGRRPDVEIAELLEIFADQAALAIDNARLYAEARHRSRRSEAMGALLHGLGQQIEVDAILKTGLNGLLQLTGAASAGFFEYDGNATLSLRAGGDASRAHPADSSLALAAQPHASRAMSTRNPVALVAPESVAEAEALAYFGCRAMLLLPLVIHGAAHGLIAARFTDQAPAPASDAYRFAQEVAGALAVALEKASLYERAQIQAMRDPVTELANHRAIVQALDAALAGAAGTWGSDVAFLLLDIDNFKLFNDTYGHPTGDAVLRRVADHLRSCSREGDVVGRYGGDEFALVLAGVDRRAAERIAARLVRAISNTPHVESDGTLIPLTASIGVAVAPEDGATRQALVAVADARMYAAKHGAQSDPLLTRTAADLLGESTFGVLEGLVSAVDAKDRYTREHSLDVTRYALLLAGALGLDESARRTLSVAGPLHDVGKIAVPDRILRKPGGLTAEEHTMIKAHVTYGVAIVRGVLDDPDVLAAIAEHHERYDGCGYPRGLRGEETSLVGRIMQIADAVSAMALDRPYRLGLPPECIISELRRGAGGQFDPALVEPFIAAFTAEHPGRPVAPSPGDPPEVQRAAS